MDDEFREVIGYPGYRVSRDGRVESRWSRRGRLCFVGDERHPLKPILRQGYYYFVRYMVADAFGLIWEQKPGKPGQSGLRISLVRSRGTHLTKQYYPTVNLARDGKKSARRIHRLVLEVFVGPCPPGMVACHNDGDRSNSDLANVRWDTPKANSDDTLRHGTRATRSRCGATKLSEADVIEIRRSRAECVSLGDLAARFNVTTYNIKAIVYRRSWRHLLEVRGGSGEDASVNLGGCCQRQGGAP